MLVQEAVKVFLFVFWTPVNFLVHGLVLPLLGWELKKEVSFSNLPDALQHHQHQAAQALHLASPQQQSALYHAGLAPTPPSMTPASNTQSPQSSFPAAQQTVFTIHPSHVQPAYTNPPHMAHVPQVISVVTSL